MITHAYRSSGLLPDRPNGFGDGLTVGVGEIAGTAVGLSLGIFVAMSEPADGVEGVGIEVGLGVSVGTNERVDGVAGIVVGVEIGVADAASSGVGAAVAWITGEGTAVTVGVAGLAPPPHAPIIATRNMKTASFIAA